MAGVAASLPLLLLLCGMAALQDCPPPTVPSGDRLNLTLSHPLLSTDRGLVPGVNYTVEVPTLTGDILTVLLTVSNGSLDSPESSQCPGGGVSLTSHPAVWSLTSDLQGILDLKLYVKRNTDQWEFSTYSFPLRQTECFHVLPEFTGTYNLGDHIVPECHKHVFLAHSSVAAFFVLLVRDEGPGGRMWMETRKENSKESQIALNVTYRYVVRGHWILLTLLDCPCPSLELLIHPGCSLDLDRQTESSDCGLHLGDAPVEEVHRSCPTTTDLVEEGCWAVLAYRCGPPRTMVSPGEGALCPHPCPVWLRPGMGRSVQLEAGDCLLTGPHDPLCGTLTSHKPILVAWRHPEILGPCARLSFAVEDPAAICEGPWIASKELCYLLDDRPLSWAKASQACRSYGGLLASVPSADDQAILESLLKSTELYGQQHGYWIGGSDRAFENYFVWADGRQVVYTNWFPGWTDGYNAQPNDDGLSGQDCVELRDLFVSSSGKGNAATDRFYWNDRDCSVPNPFICHKPRPGAVTAEPPGDDCHNHTIRLDPRTKPRDVVSSPEFPATYPADVSCLVTVTAPPGHRIRLDFSDFELEEHDRCLYDYLEILESGDLPPKRLCGNWQPRIKLLRTDSSGSKLVLRFVSDFTRAGLGFRAHVSLLRPGEGEASAGGPLCEGPQFRLERGRCYLWSEFPEVSRETAAQICAESRAALAESVPADPPSQPGAVYWLEGPEDSAGHCPALQWLRHGWGAVNRSCASPARYVCVKPAVVLPSQLNRTETAERGLVTSVNFPGHYLDNLDYWVTLAPQGSPETRMTLRLPRLELEWQQDCLYDFLEVERRLRLCGQLDTAVSGPLVSDGPSMTLHFHSDYSQTGLGFSAEWRTVPSGCQGALEAPGSLRSPLGPQFYLPGLDCFTSLKTVDDSRLLLTVVSMELAPEDDISVLLEDPASWVPLPRLRGAVVLSPGSQLQVHVKTSPGLWAPRGGYDLRFVAWNETALTSMIELKATGTLDSVNHPLDPPAGLAVQQRVEVPAGRWLALRAMAIRCGPEGDLRLLIRPTPVSLCDHTLPWTWTGLGDGLELHYRDVSFSLAYRILPPRGTYGPPSFSETIAATGAVSEGCGSCQNGGSCVQDGLGAARCVCKGPYTGRHCQMTWCETQPCGPLGLCNLTLDGYACLCGPGAPPAPHCACLPNPCINNGRCAVTNGTAACSCPPWFEGARCERYVFKIPYKPLSQRMLEEPFWLGLITVSSVLVVILCVYCIKRKFADKIEKLLAEEIERSKYNRTSSTTRYSLTSTVTPGSPSPQTSLFSRFRKPAGGLTPASRTGFEELLRRVARRPPPQEGETRDDEKLRILSNLVSSSPRRMSLDEFFRLNEKRLQLESAEEQETSLSSKLSPRFCRHSAPSFTDFVERRDSSSSSSSSPAHRVEEQIRAEITPLPPSPPPTVRAPEVKIFKVPSQESDGNIYDSYPDLQPDASMFLTVPNALAPPLRGSLIERSNSLTAPPLRGSLMERSNSLTAPPVYDQESGTTTVQLEYSPPARKYSVDLPMPKILITSNGDEPCMPQTPNPAKHSEYLSPLICCANDRTISESNLSTSGYSSLSSPGLSRCNSGSPVTLEEHSKSAPSSAFLFPPAACEPSPQRTRGHLLAGKHRRTGHPPVKKVSSYQTTSTEESIEDESLDPKEMRKRQGLLVGTRAEVEPFVYYPDKTSPKAKGACRKHIGARRSPTEHLSPDRRKSSESDEDPETSSRGAKPRKPRARSHDSTESVKSPSGAALASPPFPKYRNRASTAGSLIPQLASLESSHPSESEDDDPNVLRVLGPRQPLLRRQEALVEDDVSEESETSVLLAPPPHLRV